jgi:hypothetical protein
LFDRHSVLERFVAKDQEFTTRAGKTCQVPSMTSV